VYKLGGRAIPRVEDGSAVRFWESRITKLMKSKTFILMLLGRLCWAAAGQESEYATGREYYAEGEFRKAAAHFQLALQINPQDASSCYWLGVSYAMLGEIAVPFDHKYNVKARVYLTRATELAPAQREYRRELFDFLLDSAGSSRATVRQAAAILRAMPESDPDYSSMQWEFERESHANASVEACLGRLFLAPSRAAYRIAEAPAAVLTKRPEAVLLEARQ